jgi:hypothetical protein
MTCEYISSNTNVKGKVVCVCNKFCAMNTCGEGQKWPFFPAFIPKQLFNGVKEPLVSSYNKSQQAALFLNFILVKNSTCFGQTSCPSSGVVIPYSQK